MHIHRFKINELDPERDYGERRQGVLYYVRRFLHIYRGTEKEGNLKDVFNGHLDIIVKPSLNFALRLDVGNAGSETPWDGKIEVFGFAVYWGISRGRRLAQWLTHKRNETPTARGYLPGQYRNRSLGFSTFEGNLSTYMWVNPNGDDFRRGEKRPAKWRQGFYSTDIREHLFGSLRYRYIDLDIYTTGIFIEEANSPRGIKTAYPVELTLQRVERYRTKRPTKVLERDFSVSIDAPTGIPTHYDKSGGYKGDSTYGWSIKFPHGNVGERWKGQAIQLVVSDIYRMRGKSGFTVPQVDW